MADRNTTSSTVVTRVSNEKKGRSPDTPMMSFTAVTTHRTMAEAFVQELLKAGQQIIEDRELTVEDIFSICAVALDDREEGMTMLEGRHLRGRVAEQISRADRYEEPFSLMVLGLDEVPDKASYDSVVDTLCERMRKTDIMFLFKARIVLILPHTNGTQIRQLTERIQGLLAAAFEVPPRIGITTTTYPDREHESSSHLLDWVEDQLRS